MKEENGRSDQISLRCPQTLFDVLDRWRERVKDTHRVSKLSRQMVTRMAIEYLADAEKRGEFDAANLPRRQDDEDS